MSKKSEEELIVEAQNYGLSNYLRQYLTPSGVGRGIGERFFGNFREKMDKLREVDQAMREALLGRGQKALEPVSIKDSAKNAEKAFKDNRYIDVAHWIGNINIAIKEALYIGGAVANLSQQEIDEYFSETQETYKSPNDYFGDVKLSEAGAIDWTYKKLFGDPIEKAYAREVKLRKNAIRNLILITNAFVGRIITLFHELGKARAQGNISNWIQRYNQILKEHARFEETFKTTYNTHIVPIVEIAKKRNKQLKQQQQKVEQQQRIEQKVDERAPLVDLNQPGYKPPEKTEPMPVVPEEATKKPEAAGDKTVSSKPGLKPETETGKPANIAKPLIDGRTGRPSKKTFFVDSSGKEVDAGALHRKLKLVFEDVQDDPEITVVVDDAGQEQAKVEGDKIVFTDVMDQDGKNLSVPKDMLREYVRKLRQKVVSESAPEKSYPALGVGNKTATKPMVIVLLSSKLFKTEKAKLTEAIKSDKDVDVEIVDPDKVQVARQLVLLRLSEGRKIDSVFAYDPASKKAVELSGEIDPAVAMKKPEVQKQVEEIKRKRGRPRKNPEAAPVAQPEKKEPAKEAPKAKEPTLPLPPPAKVEPKPEPKAEPEPQVAKKDKLTVIGFKRTPANLEKLVNQLSAMLGMKVVVVSLGKDGLEKVKEFENQGYVVDKKHSNVYDSEDELYSKYPMLKITMESDEPEEDDEEMDEPEIVKEGPAPVKPTIPEPKPEPKKQEVAKTKPVEKKPEPKIEEEPKEFKTPEDEAEEEKPVRDADVPEGKDRILVFYRGSGDDREALIDAVEEMHPGMTVNVLPATFRKKSKEQHSDDVYKTYVYRLQPEEGEEELTEKQVDKYIESKKRKNKMKRRSELLQKLLTV